MMRGLLGFLLLWVIGITAQAQYADYGSYSAPAKPSTEMENYVKNYTHGGYFVEGKLQLYDEFLDFSNNYLFLPVPREQEMNFEKLMEIIKANKLTTIEEVIAALPENMKNYNYVVMYRSRSLQDATPKSPRIISYTPTASFIVTFNGGEGHLAGANTLEMVQYRAADARFEFRELMFDGKTVPKPSVANPTKCLQCHQAPSRKDVDPRPNWEPYNTWIGAFGSDNGSMKNKSISYEFDYYNRVVLPQDSEVIAEQAHEFEFFKDYVDNIAPKHPRFKLLGKLNLKAPTSLTENLGLNNFNRVARLMAKEQGIYSLYKEFINLRLRCYSLKTVNLESPALTWHMQFKYPNYFQYDDDKGLKKSDPWTTTDDLITQIYEPLGVDTSDWSMDFGSGGRFSFRSRFGLPTHDHLALRYALMQQTDDANKIEAMSCEDLNSVAAKKIDQAFATGVQTKTRSERLQAPPTGGDIVSRCISCHVNAADPFAPALPFDDLTKLRSMFNSKATTSQRTLFEEIQYRTSDMALRDHQMPPSRRLSSQEHNTLLDYIRH